MTDFDPRQPGAAGPINVVDLFCGCGGLSTGFEFVGRLVKSYRLSGAVDLDPHAIATYARNLPITPYQTDLAQATRSRRAMAGLLARFSVEPGRPLVVIGGPPCQGFSAHRKKAHVKDDERNELVLAFARVVEQLNPTFVVFENVPEVLAERNWHYYEAVRSRLTRLGYIVRAQIHNLAAFGVPQARFRTLILAARRPFAMPQPFLMQGDYRTVRDAVGHLPPVAPGELTPDDAMHFCTRHRPTTIRTIRRVPRDGGRRPHGVGPACLSRVDGFRDVYGRMYWDRPANTITAYARNPASGRYVHPEQHRGLTIREAALLQGFPRAFHFEGPFDDRFLQIGNAVPPSFAAYLAAHVLGELLTNAPPEAVDHRHAMEVLAPTSNSFSSGIAGRKRPRRHA